jgi:putative ABC transport system permease protein
VVTGLRYDLRLVGKSLRRDPRFTMVMVVSQALAVSLFATALATGRRYSAMKGQLAPDVYRVERPAQTTLERFFRGTNFEGFGTYASIFVPLRVARALRTEPSPTAESPSFVGVLAGRAEGGPPRRLPTRFCDAGLFDIVRGEFRYGGPWRRDDQSQIPPRPVTVLSDLLNQQLFGGEDSVGRTVQIAGRDFQVTGVMRQRPGKVHLWDIGVAPEHLGYAMVPFEFAAELRPVPWITWPPDLGETTWAGLGGSSRSFLEYWVRLPTEASRAAFAAALGRTDPELTLRSGDDIMARYAHAPGPYRVFVILTLVVVEASVINLMRMLLAKAVARSAELGIHRALGAPRRTIFARQLLEGVLVSMTGSLLGLALALPTIRMFDRLIPDSPVHLAVTPAIVGTALLVCLLAGLATAIYPAWRVASVQPTRYLGKV